MQQPGPVLSLFRDVHPNVITASRLILTAVLQWLVITRAGYFLPALVLFAFMAASDRLDGVVARTYGKVTEFGKFFDPLADKIFLLVTIGVATLMLISLGWAISRTFLVTIALVMLIILIEGFLTANAWYKYTFPAVREQLGSGANSYGKIKMGVEVALGSLLLLGIALTPLGQFWTLCCIVLALPVALAAIIFGCLSIIGHLKRKTV